jgi:tellurite resistance protein
MVDESTDNRAFSPEGAQEREKIRLALHESAIALQRDRLAGETGTGPIPTLAERIHALGFEDEAEGIFDLLPLVEVAWADGTIQPAERALILNILQIRDLARGKAFTTLEALLEKPPSETYVEESLAVLRELVRDQPEQAQTIVGLCVLVAESAGGFLGLRAISSKERAAITRIAEALGEETPPELRSRLF